MENYMDLEFEDPTQDNNRKTFSHHQDERVSEIERL
jgi:hypothetical protein